MGLRCLYVLLFAKKAYTDSTNVVLISRLDVCYVLLWSYAFCMFGSLVGLVCSFLLKKITFRIQLTTKNLCSYFLLLPHV